MVHIERVKPVTRAIGGRQRRRASLSGAVLGAIALEGDRGALLLCSSFAAPVDQRGDPSSQTNSTAAARRCIGEGGKVGAFSPLVVKYVRHHAHAAASLHIGASLTRLPDWRYEVDNNYGMKLVTCEYLSDNAWPGLRDYGS